MDFQELSISGVFKLSPKKFKDDRGQFFEWFVAEDFKKHLGFEFNLKQANCSTSRFGTIRGIHFALLPKGQQKYVTCFKGSIQDVVVDLRPKSSTFGKWEFVELSSSNNSVLFIPNGIGHGFISTAEESVVTYLCDQPYSPENEKSINPHDTELAIEWSNLGEKHLSERDLIAPSFEEMKDTLSNSFGDLK